MKARHAAEEKAIRERRSKLSKLVEYGEALVLLEGSRPVEAEAVSATTEPEPAIAETTEEKPAIQRRRGARSWTGTIKRILVQANRPMTFAELKDAVAETHLGETLNRTDKAFYGSIGKLTERGDIVKHKGRLFSPQAFHQFMEDVRAGRAVDESFDGSRAGTSDNAVALIRFLKGRGGKGTTTEIVQSLLTNPPDDLNVTNNRNSIYNLINRMYKNGQLIKAGDKYHLPDEDKGAPNRNGSSAPLSHHGNGKGTLLSSGGSDSHSLFALPGAGPAHPGE